ncbi:MAG TPA: tripartite tricarboxylate transporter substrate binding protein, partial [Burkholderiales bacterium]|nr:tripartite tricarboxylate transporter substrate binding protein [Burkholderiales bacterium]
YPTRPVRLIAPFSAGGGVDIVARYLALKLTEKWGQQVVVDNRTGATGIIGTEIAAHSPPDGYTLILGNAATHAVNVSLFKKLPYDAVKDFAPVTLIGRVPEMLVVHPALPAANVRELIALAKAKPGELAFGSAGAGSPPHLAGELFQFLAKVKLVHVPYKGSAPALADLIGGQISMYFSNILSAVPFVKSGRLRGLGVTSEKRSVVAPEIPTIAESGLPGYEDYNWYGILAPKGTPRAILTQLHADIVQVVRGRDMEERLTKDGAEVIASTPDEFARFIREEIDRYARIVKASGLRAE